MALLIVCCCPATRSPSFICTNPGQISANVWQVIAENLQLMPALLLCHSPPQPPSLADAHYSLSTFTKGKICNISSCLKVMIPPNRTVRKIFPLFPYSSLAIFSQNCRISLLSNTTCSPHVFLKCKISMSVYSSLSSPSTARGFVSVGFIS